MLKALRLWALIFILQALGRNLLSNCSSALHNLILHQPLSSSRRSQSRLIRREQRQMSRRCLFWEQAQPIKSTHHALLETEREWAERCVASAASCKTLGDLDTESWWLSFTRWSCKFNLLFVDFIIGTLTFMTFERAKSHLHLYTFLAQRTTFFPHILWSQRTRSIEYQRVKFFTMIFCVPEEPFAWLTQKFFL